MIPAVVVRRAYTKGVVEVGMASWIDDGWGVKKGVVRVRRGSRDLGGQSCLNRRSELSGGPRP